MEIIVKTNIKSPRDRFQYEDVTQVLITKDKEHYQIQEGINGLIISKISEDITANNDITIRAIDKDKLVIQ